ncbi:unnamed protein product [Ectocarpus sp. 12 AP-2014]
MRKQEKGPRGQLLLPAHVLLLPVPDSLRAPGTPVTYPANPPKHQNLARITLGDIYERVSTYTPRSVPAQFETRQPTLYFPVKRNNIYNFSRPPFTHAQHDSLGLNLR